jgi:hypothetical protein
MRRCFSIIMNKEEIFSIWAPKNSVWSRWAKPVLFADIDSPIVETVVLEASGEVSWAPPATEGTALVMDLPGAEGVLLGLAVAGQGYRPVPLYNAVPLPFGAPLVDARTGRAVAAVNVVPILSALIRCSEPLEKLRVPPTAPPAFLLDANRKGGERKMEPDEFDNRSISFTTDFPSANFLASQGIQSVLLVQKQSLEPQADLAHTLRRWQEGGLSLKRIRLDPLSEPERFEVARPSWYGIMFQRVLASLGFRRSHGGGFGAWVPDSSAGG